MSGSGACRDNLDSHLDNIPDWCDDCHGYTHMPYCPSYEKLSSEQPASATGSECDDHPWSDCPKCGIGICGDHIVAFLNHLPHEHKTSDNEHHQHAAQLRFLGNRAEELSSLLAGMTTERDGLRDQNERLREALLELKARAEFTLTTPGFIRGRDELRRAIEAIRPDDVFDSALNHAEQGEES